MAFPTSPPANTDPTATNKLASPSHSQLHQSHNAEIVAIEAKVGTGASTPVANRLLYGNGTGTSAWTQLTSAQLAASLTDETGTGVTVFGTSPSITTPQITTSINDSNGNEIIKTPATASATNEITITNAASGSSPIISATGSSDTNVDLTLTPKGTGTVKTSPVNSLDWTALPLGAVVQIVSVTSGAVATSTTTIPEDDTIPQITEGTEFMTLAITPKATTNRLNIRIEAFVSTSNINDVIGALFQDATTNALAAKDITLSTATGPGTIVITHNMTAGTTSSITFRLRLGLGAAGTLTFNGISGTRKFGGVTLSSITIIEYKA